MNNLIACCGLDCESCEARIATMKNDDTLRCEVAKKWCEMNNTDQITPETINCMGCRTEGVKFAFCQSMCQIRQCAQSKGYATCGDCAEVHTCPKTAPLFEFTPEAKKNLGLVQ